jgi:hypothetical protein
MYEVIHIELGLQRCWQDMRSSFNRKIVRVSALQKSRSETPLLHNRPVTLSRIIPSDDESSGLISNHSQRHPRGHPTHPRQPRHDK